MKVLPPMLKVLACAMVLSAGVPAIGQVTTSAARTLVAAMPSSKL